MVELLSLSEYEMLLSNFIPGFSKLYLLKIIEGIKFEDNLERKVHIKVISLLIWKNILKQIAPS